jgi:aminopeptidase N
MPSLTQAEAVERARQLTVHEYAIDLDLTRGDTTFRSRSTIRFGATEPDTSTFVELTGALLGATLNGRALDPGSLDGNKLPLAGLAGPGEVNELVVEADMTYSNTGEGLHRFVDPTDGAVYLYGASCPDAAQRIFACFDQPDLKAPLELAVTAPEEWTVIGNGPGRQVAPGRWEFERTENLSTYLFTVCAGPWHSIHREHDGLRLGWHCRRSMATYLDRDADELFTLTGQCFDWYHRTFEMRYPFGDKYDQVFVPEFNAGAMENVGCVTFRDEWVYRGAVTDADRELRAMVIAHEMGHMWFGDLVTLRWWNDIWLNESFAEYLGFRVASEATRFTDGRASFAGTRKLRGYMADQAPTTHPVAGEAPTAEHAHILLDAISYPKGASALTQLAAWLGDDVFLAGLRRHFARNAYGNATLADLIGAMSEASGRDLADWTERWLRTPQVSTLRPVVEVDPDGRYASVEVEQTVPAEYPVPRSHRIGIATFTLGADGTLTRDDRVEIDVPHDAPGGRTPVPALVGRPAADLLLLNDGDLTFANIRFDERSADRLADTLPALAEPLARALVWGATWDMVRDGEITPERFVELVAAGLPSEPQLSVVSQLLRFGRVAATRYVVPERQDAALAALAAASRRMLDGSEPGSGHQLAAAKGLAETATTADDLDVLHGWLSDGAPEGLRMDAELRWAVLVRLVATGRAGAADIDAELAADPTAEGQVYALRCRAALPDADAKRWAWEALTADRGRPNRHLEALASGFWQPGQDDVTAPYVERFFLDVPATAAWRGPDLLSLVAVLAYPSYAVAPGTVTLAEKLLTREDLNPVLRRTVVDCTHELRVALAARTVSASATVGDWQRG